MEIISWIGSILLALCGLPIAVEAIRKRKSDINLGFLTMWLFGEIFTLVYVVYKQESALTFNYLSNIIFIAIVLRYRF
jgi:uncharacterized protein with PQ loop repeat